MPKEIPARAAAPLVLGRRDDVLLAPVDRVRQRAAGEPSPGAGVTGDEPSPGADVAAMSPVPGRMREGRARSQCRRGRGEKPILTPVDRVSAAQLADGGKVHHHHHPLFAFVCACVRAHARACAHAPGCARARMHLCRRGRAQGRGEGGTGLPCPKIGVGLYCRGLLSKNSSVLGRSGATSLEFVRRPVGEFVNASLQHKSAR